LEATARKWRNDSVNKVMQFFKMHLFWEALPGDLRKVVAQQNPNTMTLDDMYQIATTTQREAGIKTSKSIAAIKHNKDRCSEDQEFAAFQKQKFGKASDQKKKLQTQPVKHFTPQTGPGNNSNCNGKYCFYCKLQNHTKEE
jgi:hypothetical protein